MRPDHPLWHAKHIVRMGLLLLFGLAIMIAVRSLLVPDTWGRYGWYRAANVAEQRDHPLMHAGDAACGDCHDEQEAAHAAGVHAPVKCELCHAPLALHVKDGEVVAPMPVRKTVDLCVGCHQRLPARPADFPQIQPRQHVEEMGGEYGPAACFDCHDPHSPL